MAAWLEAAGRLLALLAAPLCREWSIVPAAVRPDPELFMRLWSAPDIECRAVERAPFVGVCDAEWLADPATAWPVRE